MKYYTNPDRTSVHMAIVYRNFMAHGYSHIGLGVNGLLTAKVLRRLGIATDVFPVAEAKDIRGHLKANPTITHVVIEAPFVPIGELTSLLYEFPKMHFVVRSHSEIAFLQVEPGAVMLIREMLVLQDGQLNLTVAANSEELSQFIEDTYDGRCLYLPNLYDAERPTGRRWRPPHHHRTLRIGAFGALRLLKNHTTAAAAALEIARHRGSDLEFWMSVNRKEGVGADAILQTVRNMFTGLKWATFVENSWESWPEFRRTIGNMDLCLQPSFTETFNIVTADAAAAGVPTVTTSAIEWVPKHWHAEADSIESVARVGSCLLSDPHASRDGLEALQRYCENAERLWLAWLDEQP